MSVQSYKLLRVVGGRTYYAQVTVDVDAAQTSAAVVSAEAFAWLKDVYGPDAHEWEVCGEYRDGALFGVEYALAHLGSPRPRPRVTVTRIEASPADTCRDAVAVAACHATWAALGDSGTGHPRITADGIAFDTISLGDRQTIATALMARAWREAARDLAVRFESPFAMHHVDRDYWCSGYLPDFGGPKGAVIIDRHSVDDIFDIAEALGYYASGLNPLYYESYDRERFQETLNDWGWLGDVGAAPDWFTGGLGRHGGSD